MQRKSRIIEVVRCIGLGLAALAAPVSATAAPDRDRAAIPTGVELIAFEASGCIYCPVFRRDVAPTYAASRAGKAAPLRFIDVNDTAADALKLSGPVTIVPTLVLVRDGVEIGRISGYVGPQNMHHILDTMLPRD